MQRLIDELTQLPAAGLERARQSNLRSLAARCGFDGKRLARLCNVSPRHLQRVFSANLSRSPQSWLNEQRLLAAREMLKTASSVKEVAHTLGFKRASQFSRDFRRMFGLTPSEFSSTTVLLELPLRLRRRLEHGERRELHGATADER